jgi:hypothetical protein
MDIEIYYGFLEIHWIIAQIASARVTFLAFRSKMKVNRAVVKTLRTIQAIRTPALAPRCDFVLNKIVRMAWDALL